MPCGHLNAMRFAQKPLAQPAYAFCHVPKATSALEHSSLQRLDHREHFQTCMAEMLLLGKEAVRRRACSTTSNNNNTVVTNSAAKPLSLEYLADRMDVDDPCFGFVVRTNTPPPTSSSGDNNNGWKKGMLQGFITVTTFTNWQKTFQWDSLALAAFSADPPALQRQRLVQGVRTWDCTGALSQELQATVHKGDPFGEGIVWPHIAEISLLGGLGCGRTLVKLALEQLEGSKASGAQNYEYVVLQATDNSIPFYESLGFVRVGGIMEDKDANDTSDTTNSGDKDNGNANDKASPLSTLSSSSTTTNNSNNDEPRSEMVTSDITTYTTKKRGEQPQEIAKKLKVNVYDILFLNQGLFVEAMTGASKLLLGTTLQVPATKKKERRAPTRVSSRHTDDNANDNTTELIKEETPNWYTAKENDTPTKIAKMFHVSCPELLKANAKRLPGLISKSRLRNGTRVQVSHFHIATKVWMAYSHWSFPDDEIEDGEPSYMMCYKLQRRNTEKPQQQRRRSSGAASVVSASSLKEESSCALVVDSLKTKVLDYTPSPLLWQPTPEKAKPDDTLAEDSIAAKVHPRRCSNLKGTSLAPIMEAAAASPSKNPPILVARDTNRDTLVQVKVVTEGKAVVPSPMPTNGKTASRTPAAASTICDTPKTELKPPKRAMGSFVLFCQDMRKRKAQLLEGLTIANASRVLADRWQKAPRKVKQKFEKLAGELKQEYMIKKEEYEKLVAVEKAKQHALQQEQQFQRRDSIASTCSDRSLVGEVMELDAAGMKQKDHDALYNKIVRVKPEAIPFTAMPKPTGDILDKNGEKSDDPTSSPELQPDYYKYWFVLTYIPDLKWCHVVPLVQVGEFTIEDKKPRLLGRPKWKLVDERLCQEIDISSRYVVPVKSRETKRSSDANREEWDIRDQDEEDLSSEEGSRSSSRKSTGGKRGRKRSKPASPSSKSRGKKRAYQSPFTSQPTPANPTMRAAPIEGSNCKWAPPRQLEITLPPMNLSLSALKPTNLSGENSAGSPPSPGPGQYPPGGPGPGHHHPPSGYYNHPHQGPYPYPPPPGYHPHDNHMGPGPQFHRHHGPPPPGWPGHVPFPPQGPYPPPQHHHHHQHGPPPPHAYHHHPQHQQHHPDQQPPPYFQPFPMQPPAVGTPSCNRTSSAGLELSVERVEAI